MPITNGMGHSKETQYKSEIVDEITNIQFRIVQKIWAKRTVSKMFPFFYMDLYCGSGANPDDGDPSASLCLIKKLCQQEFDFDAVLIDKGCDDDGTLHIDSMRQRLSEYERDRVRMYPDNALKIVPPILRSLRNRPLGLIFIDPNGPKDLPELNPLFASIPQTQSIDLLFHIGAAHINRARACKALPSYQWYLSDMLALARKDRGFIKRSPESFRHKWLYILLTNAPERTMGEWAKRGWYDIAGDIGRDTLRAYNYTQAELEMMEQDSLFNKNSWEDDNESETA